MIIDLYNLLLFFFVQSRTLYTKSEVHCVLIECYQSFTLLIIELKFDTRQIIYISIKF